LGEDYQLQFLRPLDPLFFILKVDLFAALMATLPFFLVLVLRYASPALPRSVRWWTPVLLLGMLGLAFVAALYAYHLVIPTVLTFLSGLTLPGFTNDLTAQAYLNFFLSMLFMHVIVFQTPVAVLGVSALRIWSPAQIASARRYVYLGLFVGIAIITPTTDVATFLALAVPASLMFEGGLLVARLVIHGSE
jgi:sec-independent protein translocase protein TatC